MPGFTAAVHVSPVDKIAMVGVLTNSSGCGTRRAQETTRRRDGRPWPVQPPLRGQWRAAARRRRSAPRHLVHGGRPSRCAGRRAPTRASRRSPTGSRRAIVRESDDAGAWSRGGAGEVQGASARRRRTGHTPRASGISVTREPTWFRRVERSRGVGDRRVTAQATTTARTSIPAGTPVASH